jgi:D-alanine--poly(phosphoribitol) ligase subunit 2
MDGADVEARVIAILREVTECAAVGEDPDLPLYGSGLLDSLGTVTLMAALGEAFGLDVAPSDFEREAWSTPARVVADVRRRLALAG